MKQKTLFRGIATALATPMTSSGAIDYDAYGRLIDWQIESGVAGLVTCGTTGEASTMTAEEHRQTIAFAVKEGRRARAGHRRHRRKLHRKSRRADAVCLHRRSRCLSGGDALLQ